MSLAKLLTKLLASTFFTILSVSAQAQGIVNIPSSIVDIQSVVNSHDPGTHYKLEAGVYRNQTIYLQEGDIFEGLISPNGQRAILNGSILISSNSLDWTAIRDAQNNILHYKYNTIVQTRNKLRVIQGNNKYESINDADVCDDNGKNPTACFLPEDLFVNNVPLLRRLPGTALQAGEWYLIADPPATADAEFVNSTIYMKEPPISGASYELSVTRSAFKASANNVSIKNLVVEKYAIPIQGAAIGDTWDINSMLGNNMWIIEGNEVRFNHGGGIYFSDESTVSKNFVHHNGSIGIGGGGKGGKVEENEIAYNKIPEIGYEWKFEGGGTKFAYTTDLLVRKNTVHHNYGPGLWTDINNVNTLYESNTCTDNYAGGIFHEISFSAIIRNNILARNGDGDNQSGEIVIANSSNVEIYNNKLTVAFSDGTFDNAAPNSYGITISNTDRNNTSLSQPFPSRWYGLNNYIHHNDITYLYSAGSESTTKSRFTKITAPYNPNPNPGTGGKYDFWQVGNTQLNYNTYHMPDINASAWWWNTEKINLTDVKLKNQESSTIVDNVVTAEPSNLSTNNSNPIIFQRAINLGGSQVTIDRQEWGTNAPIKESKVWEAGASSSTDFSYVGTINNSQENNTSFSLITDISILNEPTTGSFNQNLDANRAKMIRSWIGPKSDGTSPSLQVTVPNSNYDVYLYIVEDNSTSDTYSVQVEGITFLQNYITQPQTSAHYWQKLGPWPVSVTDGKIDVVAVGKANFSGIEIRKNTKLPSTAPALTITSPTTSANSFIPGTNITITATAADADGLVSKVEFFNGTTKLGEVSSAPYDFIWNNVAKGTYKIRVKATDNSDISNIKEIDIVVYPTTSEVINRTETVCNACVTGGGPNNGDDAKDAFDNGIAVTGGYDSDTNWEPGASRSWIQYKFASDLQYPISEYTITSYETTTTPTGRHDPKQWVLKGSNDGVNYTVLDSRSNQIFTSNETKRFYIINNSPYKNVTSYKYYRFDFYDNDWTLIVREIDLYERDNPPTVSISSPTANANFAFGSNITITATAADDLIDPANNQTKAPKVEFYNGTTKLGEDLTSPYSFTWNNVAAGNYSFTAKATETFKLTGTAYKTTSSTAVPITVLPCTQPNIYIASPANGQICRSISLILSGTISGASSYTVEINTASDFSGTSIIKTTTSQYSTGAYYALFPELAFNTTYYARVRTNLTSCWGPIRNFTTTSAEGFSFVFNPGNGGTTTGTTLYLNTVPRATTYYIELFTNPGLSGTPALTGSTSTAHSAGTYFANFPGLVIGQTYWARVRTNAVSPYTGWGNHTSFTRVSPGARVDFSENLTENEIYVYPNPFESKLTLYTEQAGKHYISVMDNLGRTVYKATHTIQAIESEIDLSKATLTAGVYFVSIRSDQGQTKVIKVLKK